MGRADWGAGALAVGRPSRWGVPRSLAYRRAAVTLLSAAGLAVAAPLSGLVPASATGALLLAVPLGPLVTLATRSEEHTSELQSQSNLVCRLLLEKTNNTTSVHTTHTPAICHA